MNNIFFSLVLLLILVPLCQSTGIVWIRMSSSRNVAVRIEFVDKENSSRYGISLDLQLFANNHKEYVLPMPPSSSNSHFPIFDYCIQMFHPITNSLIGKKIGNRLPLLVNEPWIHKTVFTENGISIFTSIRFECLPHYYGSKCQYYCTAGEKCTIDECPKKKCQNNSQCLFDGFVSKCLCQSRYSGEFCEKKAYFEDERILQNTNGTVIFVIFLIIITAFIVFFIAVQTILKIPTAERKISEPMDSSVEEESEDDYIVEKRFQIFTSCNIIFSDW